MHNIRTSPPCLQRARAQKEAPPESLTDKVLQEEQDMMRHVTQKQALRAAKELATDIVYTRSMTTGWKPPAEARMSPSSLVLLPAEYASWCSRGSDPETLAHAMSTWLH